MGTTETLRSRFRNILASDLVEPPDDKRAGAFLYCLVNALHIGFGRHLRAVFLIGSYAHGGHTRSSDIDLSVLWKDSALPSHRRKALSLCFHIGHLAGYLIDPMYDGPETPFYAADDFGDPEMDRFACGPILKLAVKDHSRLLWGADVRSRIVVGTSAAFRENVLWTSLSRMCRLRGVEPDPCGSNRLGLPLAAPDPSSEDLGYGDPVRATAFAVQLARALVYLDTGEYPLRKTDVADAFERTTGGEWAAFIRRLLDTGAKGKRQAHSAEMYRHLTRFEGYFLERLQDRQTDLSAYVRI